MAWDIKYRPRTFADVIGQDGTVKVLKARLAKGNVLDSSYIFAGMHGSGKTTLARILARAMLCENITSDAEPCNECDNCRAVLDDTSPGYSERDAASNGTVEVVRAVVDELPYALPGVKKRIYTWDESHRMTTAAQDVLLKPTEDKRLVNIFCTTEPEKIRPAIKSRCEYYSIRKITPEGILGRMKHILDLEGVQYVDEAVLLVIEYSGNHVRDVINRLETISQVGPITVDGVRSYLTPNDSLYYEILLALANPAEAIRLTEEACNNMNPEDVAAGLAEAAMNVYRASNGMFSESSGTTKDIVSRIYQMYGDSVVLLAQKFVRPGRVTKTSLLLDVVCKTSAGSSPAPIVIQSIPVQPMQSSPAIVQTTAPTVKVVESSKSSTPSTPSADVKATKNDNAPYMSQLELRALPPVREGTEGTPLKSVKGGPEPDYITAEVFRTQFRLIMGA